MPVFNGFEGEKFKFQGAPDKFFNLISDDYLQVNAHFDIYGNMDQIGMKLGTPHTYIKCDATKGKVLIDDRILYKRSYFPIGLHNFDGYAEIRFQFEANNFNASVLQNQGEFISCVFIEAGKYHFYVIRNKNDNHFSYNFLATIRNPTVRPHGIIGQTADFDGKPRLTEYNGYQGEGIIEGKWWDYETLTLWCDNFKYNKFRKEMMKL